MGFAELFDKHGSDKERLMGYGVVYDELTRGRRICAVLEVGVKRGASVAAWAEGFPSAKVFGVDLDLRDVPNTISLHPRVYLFQLDSTAPRPSRAPTLYTTSFDLIVDDGAHDLRSQTLTARNFLPQLAPGGVYVVEDVTSDENADALLDLASQEGLTARAVVSAAAPGILDNQLVVMERQ